MPMTKVRRVKSSWPWRVDKDRRSPDGGGDSGANRLKVTLNSCGLRSAIGYAFVHDSLERQRLTGPTRNAHALSEPQLARLGQR